MDNLFTLFNKCMLYFIGGNFFLFFFFLLQKIYGFYGLDVSELYLFLFKVTRLICQRAIWKLITLFYHCLFFFNEKFMTF